VTAVWLHVGSMFGFGVKLGCCFVSKVRGIAVVYRVLLLGVLAAADIGGCIMRPLCMTCKTLADLELCNIILPRLPSFDRIFRCFANCA
jgi:hypothetical protein